MLFKIFEVVLVVLGKLHFEFISKKFQYKSPSEIEIYQYKKLRQLLLVAYNEIPFYKNKFNAEDFDPLRDFNTLSDFSKVPVLSKEEARSFSDELINKKRKFLALEFKTSGSTGEPFSTLISPMHWIIEQSCVWRHWSWAGYKFRDRMAIVRSHVPTSERDLIRWDRARNFIYFSPFHLSDSHIKNYLSEMCRLKVKFIRGYPSSIRAIADYIHRNPGVEKPSIRGVLTASEMLDDVARSVIERAFGAKVFNHYGLAEQIVMFGGCENGSHLHNYEEYGFLDFEDTDVVNVKKIIGTNLHNYAMPLIKYDTGDLADLSGGNCACCRSSKVLRNVIGRESAKIDLSDGSSVPVTNFYTMFEHYGDRFASWQIIQRSKGILEIVVSAYKNVDLVQLESELKLDIEKRIDDNALLTFKYDGEFIKVGEGKRNPFIKVGI
ncbi:MAG: hypothetical protein RPR91_04275 [Colwellia sp.]